MLLPHVYISPCIVQLRRRVVKLSRCPLLNGAARASQRATPYPAPPRPAVNVDVGTPSIVTSAHANCAGFSGEVEMVDDGTHAAGGVAAAEWLAASLAGSDVTAGGEPKIELCHHHGGG